MAWCSVKAQGQLHLYTSFHPTREECRASASNDSQPLQLLTSPKRADVPHSSKYASGLTTSKYRGETGPLLVLQM
jgi:hypothetical protein